MWWYRTNAETFDVKRVTEIKNLAALKLNPNVFVTTSGGATTVIKTVNKRRKVVKTELPKGGWLPNLQTSLVSRVARRRLPLTQRPSSPPQTSNGPAQLPDEQIPNGALEKQRQ